MVFLIELLLETLVDPLIFFAGGEVRRQFEGGEASSNADVLGFQQPEK